MKALICTFSAVGIVSLGLPELGSLSFLNIKDFRKKGRWRRKVSAPCQKSLCKVPLSGLLYGCLFGMPLQDANRSSVYSFQFANHDRYY